MATKRFITPFADTGIKAPISDVPAGTDVNYETGYTPEYALDPVSDPAARFVEITNENQILNDITGNTKLWQENVYPEFITSTANGGVAWEYKKGDVVLYDGVNYESLEDSNTELPTTSKWVVHKPNEVLRAILIAQGLSGNYGFFAKGVTYTSDGDVGVSDDNKFYKYVGEDDYPVVIAAGTNPLGADFEQVYFDSVNDKSQTYNFPNVAAYKTFKSELPVGKMVYLEDRQASFTVINGTNTADDFSIIGSNEVSQSLTLEVKNLDAIHLGADTTGATDSQPAMQYMVDTYGYLNVGVGNFILNSPVVFTDSRSSIKGVTGETRITVQGDFGAFTVSGEIVPPLTRAPIVAETYECSGFVFSSLNRAEGSGIFTETYQYLSHWDIHNCYFERRLAFGIRANTVGCNIHHNIFGFTTPSNDDNFKPLELTGQLDNLPSTPLLPNANVIANNWIIRSSKTVNAAIELSAGVQNTFRENLIENCEATTAIILLDGDIYPKIHHNYFEKPQAPAVVKIQESVGGTNSTVFLQFEHNNVLVGTGSIPTEYILDFNGAVQDLHSFVGNIVYQTQVTTLAVVRDKDGGLNTFQGCQESYGNFFTGSMPTAAYGYLERSLPSNTNFVSPLNFSQVGAQNSTNELARFGWRSETLVNAARVPSGVGVDIDIGGKIAVKFDDNSTGGNSRFFLYDNVTNTLQRVKIGANNSQSGGRGLYINNS